MLLAWQHADTRFVHQPKRWCIYRKQGGGSGRVAKVISTGQKTPFKLGTDTLLKFIDDSKKRGQLDVTLSRTDKWIKHCALAGYWKNVIWVKHRVHKWQIFTSKNTKGGYINGNNTKEVLEYIKKALDNIEKNEFEAQQFTDYNSQFQWFLGMAFFLLFLDVFFLEKKTEWLKKLNLFNEKA